MACPKSDNYALIWYLCYSISYFNNHIQFYSATGNKQYHLHQV